MPYSCRNTHGPYMFVLGAMWGLHKAPFSSGCLSVLPGNNILDGLSGVNEGGYAIVGKYIGCDLEEDVVRGKHAQDTRYGMRSVTHAHAHS